ncbi:FHA domain-containing protein [Planomonospora sp. ID82291]|uniref:FHA domain-containing protein n=1 Tax=Planomonospora sp. ID82291 TaxID=2738136 RepID=UPI0018C4170C|nr:FHA domain-containing protein [Planomonospora sp. ID82291]MBG0816798.1 FHA domain-containing protein [Planomonospora sp. ID82291]
MTDQGFGAVRPLPGNGLVAHVGGLLLVCDAAEAVMEDLLRALRETAASGGDGRALARRVAQVLAAMMGEPVACAVAGPVPEGVAVLVSGPASASVTGSAGEVRLAGRDALTWSDRLVPGPVTRVELRLPEAGAAQRLTRLDGGVVVGGGVECDPSAAGATPPLPAPQARSADSAPRAPELRTPEPAPMMMEPAPVTPPPVEAPVVLPAAHSDWSPFSSEPSAASAVPAPSEWSAPPAEAAPPAQPAPPYPMGPPPTPQDHYAQPPLPPAEPQVPAHPWDSGPMPSVPAQGQGPLSGPAFASQEDMETARANGMGGDPLGPGDLRNESFEYELLTPGGPPGSPDLLPPAAPEPESRPLVHGVDCKNDHFNDPRVPYCAVCGIALVQRTLVPYKGPRPPLGVLLLDDGMTLRLDADYLLGRDPERAPEVADGAVRPAKVTSPDGSVSRRHLRVALDGWDVNLIDLGSVNGTQIQPPGDPNFYDIPPNEPVTIMPGTTVRIGVSRTMRYESHRNR